MINENRFPAKAGIHILRHLVINMIRSKINFKIKAGLLGLFTKVPNGKVQVSSQLYV